jgi:glycosyltransferase involved in cell wall biosynthesis
MTPESERILVLSSHFPYPPTNGSQLRLWALLRALAANGHEVDLLALGDLDRVQPYWDAVRRVCRSVEVIPHVPSSLSTRLDLGRRLVAAFSRQPYGAAAARSAGVRARISEAVRERRIDAVLCEETDQLVNVPDPLPVPLIVDNQNAEFVVLERYRKIERSPARSAYAALEAWKLRRWEQAACSRADLALVCSEVDRAIFRRLCPKTSIAVAPNVIDAAQYRPDHEEEPGAALYTGGMDWFPNRDAVRHFAGSILPLLQRLAPGARFIVAGRRGPEEFHQSLAGVPGVEFHSAVTDMREEIGRAAVCVVPLRIGSGTRLKILEAAAMARPIVSTHIGAEGLDFVDGRDIVLADEPEDFARAVAAFLSDAGRRAAFGEAARRRVVARYSLDALQAALRKAMILLPARPERARARAAGAGR